MELKDFNDFLDRNPAYLASVDENGFPNLTIVRAKVLSDNELLIADVQMEKCKKNLFSNSNCCLVTYSEQEKNGFKVFGRAKYYSEGQYLEKAKELAGKRNFEAVGALVVEVDKLMY
jgi:predicted pyridoxine 5'-phosphate oxidase superfamily flavin-nucleotide-binding protein